MKADTNIKENKRNFQTKKILDLSIVIPIHNEEQNILPLFSILSNVLASLNNNYEIIFIDDGSTDNSLSILQTVFEENNSVKVIQFSKRFGKAAALQKGFQYAKGNIIITLDADLQDDPHEIPKFIKKIYEGYDLVSGWKYIRHDPLTKTLPSKIFNIVTSFMTKIPLHDFGSGIKAYRKEVVKSINIYGELHRYIPILAYDKGFKIGEIKVKHHPRLKGVSKYGFARYFRGFYDFLTVLFLTKYNKKPLHLFGSLGLLFLLAGLLINIYLSILKILGEGIGTRPLLFLGILLMIVGIQFISTGLVCEMITRMNHKIKTRRVMILIKFIRGEM
jgi:glycosyltransferase involved in cell wall biosynthesis